MGVRLRATRRGAFDNEEERRKLTQRSFTPKLLFSFFFKSGHVRDRNRSALKIHLTFIASVAAGETMKVPGVPALVLRSPTAQRSKAFTM